MFFVLHILQRKFQRQAEINWEKAATTGKIEKRGVYFYFDFSEVHYQHHAMRLTIINIDHH